MKTEFEEFWSFIFYSNYLAWDHKDLIRFWYLNNNRLEKIKLNQIYEKRDGLLEIIRDDEMVEIPIYRIYAITYEDTIVMNRTRGYQGKADMKIDVKDWL